MTDTTREPLIARHCVPCEGGVAPLGEPRVQEYLALIPAWEVRSGKLCRALVFPNFVAAMRLLNEVANVAEAEGHHPDFCLHDYNKVDFSLWTHAIGGLSENDFILAARIDQLLP